MKKIIYPLFLLFIYSTSYASGINNISNSNQFTDLVNGYRTKLGLNKIKYSSVIERAAQYQVQYAIDYPERNYQSTEGVLEQVGVPMENQVYKHIGIVNENIESLGYYIFTYDNIDNFIFSFIKKTPEYTKYLNDDKYSRVGVFITHKDNTFYASIIFVSGNEEYKKEFYVDSKTIPVELDVNETNMVNKERWVKYVNEYRNKLGLNPVKYHSDLENAAKIQAVYTLYNLTAKQIEDSKLVHSHPKYHHSFDRNKVANPNSKFASTSEISIFIDWVGLKTWEANPHNLLLDLFEKNGGDMEKSSLIDFIGSPSHDKKLRTPEFTHVGVFSFYSVSKKRHVIVAVFGHE